MLSLGQTIQQPKAEAFVEEEELVDEESQRSRTCQKQEFYLISNSC